MIRTLLLASFLLAGACAGPVQNESETLAALQASREADYGIPDIGDAGLTARVTLAATKWAQMSDSQLLEWSRIWSKAQPSPERPVVEYTVGSGQLALQENLFDRSPKDGFCVAWAISKGDGDVPADMRDFLDRRAP